MLFSINSVLEIVLFVCVCAWGGGGVQLNIFSCVTLIIESFCSDMRIFLSEGGSSSRFPGLILQTFMVFIL